MKKVIGLLALVVCCSVLLPCQLLMAAEEREPYPMTRVPPCEPDALDIAEIEYFEGEVIKVFPFSSAQPGVEGLHVRVQTSAEVIEICLGPAWYLEAQGVMLQPGDKIQIYGLKVNNDDELMVVATAIGWDCQTRLLHNSSQPLWRPPS